MSQISIRIDVRSSLSLVVFAIIAIALTIFILIRAEFAIQEIEKLSEVRANNIGDATGESPR